MLSAMEKYIKLLLSTIDDDQNNISANEYSCSVTKIYRNIHGMLCMSIGCSYRNENDPQYPILGGQLAENRCLIKILQSWKKDINGEINNLKYIKHSIGGVDTGELIDFYLLVKRELTKKIKYLYKMNNNRIDSYYPNES